MSAIYLILLISLASQSVANLTNIVCKIAYLGTFNIINSEKCYLFYFIHTFIPKSNNNSVYSFKILIYLYYIKFNCFKD